METRTIKSMVYALSVSACACGGVGTYNLLATPESRLGGYRYDGVSLLGPTLVSLAVLSFIVPRLVNGSLPSEVRIRSGRRLKIAGGVLGVVPPALGAAHAALFHGEGAYLLLLALIVFTGPGLCFFLFGAVLEAIGQRNCRNATRKS